MQKKTSSIPTPSEFSINTGFIYTSLTSNWQKHPRELFSKLEERLEIVLSGKVFSI